MKSKIYHFGGTSGNSMAEACEKTLVAMDQKIHQPEIVSPATNPGPEDTKHYDAEGTIHYFPSQSHSVAWDPEKNRLVWHFVYSIMVVVESADHA